MSKVIQNKKHRDKKNPKQTDTTKQFSGENEPVTCQTLAAIIQIWRLTKGGVEQSYPLNNYLRKQKDSIAAW